MQWAEVQESKQTKGKYRFPPGMKRNLAWDTILRRRLVNPIVHFQGLADRYGDVAHYRVGKKDIIFVNDPEYIREILVVQHAKFIKERTQQRSKLLLGEGMITSDGTAHRKQRQVAQPAFHRQQIPTYAEAIVRRAAMLERWTEGESRDVYRDMMHLTLGTVGETLFSTELGGEIEELNAGVSEIMDVYHAIVLLPGVKYLLRIPFTRLNKFVKARDRLDRTVKRMIAAHRERGVKEGSLDLLDLILSAQEQMGWTDRDLRDQVVSVFLAGYETMAIALTWAWYLLSQNSGERERVFAEVDTVLDGRLPTYDDLPRLKYTEMVLAESMRLYPPAWAMGRLAIADFELGPYRLPKGTTVLMSQFVTHRDARFFPNPLRFNPERHTPEAKARRGRFTYFPFGMGPRQCIGEAFAWMEGVLVLATIAQRWKLDLVPGHSVEAEPLFTLRPKYGMRMLVSARQRM